MVILCGLHGGVTVVFMVVLCGFQGDFMVVYVDFMMIECWLCGFNGLW